MTRASVKSMVLGGVAIAVAMIAVSDVEAGWRRRAARNHCCAPVAYHHHHDACGCQHTAQPCGASAGCPCGTTTTYSPTGNATEYSAARPIIPDGQFQPVPAEGYQPAHADPNWREGAVRDNRNDAQRELNSQQRQLNQERRELNRDLNQTERELNRNVDEAARNVRQNPNIDAEAAAEVNAALQATP